MLLWKESIHSSGCQQGFPELLTYLRFFITLTVLHLIKFYFVFLKRNTYFQGFFLWGELSKENNSGIERKTHKVRNM